MEFITSIHNKRKLLNEGYVYLFQKTLSGGVQNWECEHRRKGEQCKAKLKIRNDVIVDRLNEHTHAPNQTRCELLRVRGRMKRKAETTQETTYINCRISQCFRGCNSKLTKHG